MRAYMPGEPVEAYLIEMTNELVTARPTTGTFIAPAMTGTEIGEIVGPARGMLVFNTTTGTLYYYSGSAWGAV